MTPTSRRAGAVYVLSRVNIYGTPTAIHGNARYMNWFWKSAACMPAASFRRCRQYNALAELDASCRCFQGLIVLQLACCSACPYRPNQSRHFRPAEMDSSYGHACRLTADPAKFIHRNLHRQAFRYWQRYHLKNHVLAEEGDLLHSTTREAEFLNILHARR